MVLVTPDRPHTTDLTGYVPRAELAEVWSKKVLRRTQRTAGDYLYLNRWGYGPSEYSGDHFEWTGPGFYGVGLAPRVMVKGRSFTIFDFAYLAQVDDIWPGLRATPFCGRPLCLAASHLKLRRRGPRPYPALTEADWDELACRLYLTGPRKVHRHLRNELDIGDIYEAPEADHELARRNTQRAYSIPV
ncbi:MAG: hypothetical protein EPN91_07495 [Salinibacterium sp.]|nr:MAG: hypothetical protein EPN91_07495 [Salinibacterium sp.]